MAPRQRTFSSPCRSADDDSISESSSRVSSSLKQAMGKPSYSSNLNLTEADVARELHDYFNLGALVFIVGTIVLNYDFNLWGLEITYTGNQFWLNWMLTVLYFLVDLVWVAVVPICVKSPDVIIKHHIVASLYMMAPVYYPEYRWFMGAVLSVEVNTWFLILRRVVFKSSNVKPVSPVVAFTVSGMFYATWILIRCIIYPMLLVTFLGLAREKIAASGSYFHLPMVFIPVHAILCALNLKWTFDLFQPIVKRWLGTDPKPMVVQNGL